MNKCKKERISELKKAGFTPKQAYIVAQNEHRIDRLVAGDKHNNKRETK